MRASRIRVPARRSWSGPRDATSALGLSDGFRAWVVDNAVRGVPGGSLISVLVEGGVPERLAVAEVGAILASPALDACRRLDARVEALELVAALARSHARHAPVPAAVERRETVSAAEFFEGYFAANRPVVLTRFLDGWRARGRWSPDDFKARFGDVEIEIMAGRDADPACDRNFEAHRTRVRMGDYVDQVTGGGPSNDVYMVAHNNALQRTALAGLLDDVAPDEAIFDRAHLATQVSLWFGPRGTTTPLHHDTTNILFCQVYGRKRVRLIAPTETALLDRARGFYAEIDCDDPRFQQDEALRAVLIKDVELAAGEALFIPAGWWHRVSALEVSINLSLLGFRRPNDFDWYRPGARGEG